VSNVNWLENALKLDPGNDELSAALTDELIETNGMTREEADKHVEDLRRPGLMAHVHACSTLMQKHNPERHVVNAILREYLHVTDEVVFTGLLTTGSSSPVITKARPEIGAPADRMTVLVGASWLLHEYRKRTELPPVGTNRKRPKRRR